MTKLKLEKIRDEMASKYGLDKFPVQNIKTTSEFTQDVNFARRMSHTQAYQDGHDASTAIHQQQIQKLVEALNEISMYGISEPNTQAKIAIKAINDFKTWSENE